MMKADQQEPIKQQNQIFSQILLPFIIALFSTGVAGYFLFSNLVSDTADFRIWSDISVMVIFLPFIVIGPLLIMLMIAHIVLVAMLRQKVVELGKKLKPLFNKVSGVAADLAGLSTKSLIALKSGFSSFNKRSK